MSEDINSSDSEYFLHSMSGDSFHFRRVKHPNSSACSFTVTYVFPGYGFMSGDLGCLCWHRHEGMDYGFPNEKTGMDYFAEKVKLANSDQIIRVWDLERARYDLQEYFREEADQERFPGNKINELVERSYYWGDYGPEVGKFKMVEDLNEIFGSHDWYEYQFGEKLDDWLIRRLKILKSVSQLILNAVKRDKQEVKEKEPDWEMIMPCKYSPLGYSTIDCSHWRAHSLICNLPGRGLICGRYHELERSDQ